MALSIGNIPAWIYKHATMKIFPQITIFHSNQKFFPSKNLPCKLALIYNVLFFYLTIKSQTEHSDECP